MIANELRIGNLVDTIHRGGTVHLPRNRPVKIYNVAPFRVLAYPPHVNPATLGVIQEHDITDLCGIPITGEVLLKFGFEHHHDSTYVLYSEHLSIDILRHDINWDDDFNCGGIEYVHQLQNLFFAAAHRELTYTP